MNNPTRWLARSVSLLVLTGPLLGLGCAGTPQVVLLVGGPSDRTALDTAAEAFYAATGVAELEAAVEAARAAAPDSAVYHELAAQLSLLRADDAARIGHLLAALRDRDDDKAGLHLEQLDDLDWSLCERRQAEGLLAALAREHADPAVRARAQLKLARLAHLRGDLEGTRARRAAIGGQVELAVIGVWDNDQGKGFELELPPEKQIDLAARYPGSLVEIGWRRDLPRSPVGGELDLAALMNPSRWAIAYAAGAVTSPAGGAHELRVWTSGPVKIWLNGTLLYAERSISDGGFDQLVLPVDLQVGANQLLFKSAQTSGSWRLSARFTGPGGAPAMLTQVEPTDAPAIAAAEAAVTTDQLLADRVAHLPEGSARRDHHLLEWAAWMGMRNHAVLLADGALGRHPESIMLRYTAAMASWRHSERGRTADLLEALVATSGDPLPRLALRRARYLSQENLLKEARGVLLGLRGAHPEKPEVWLELAELFEREGWREDRCRALEEAARVRQTPGIQSERAGCWRRLGFADRARRLYEELRRELPGFVPALGELQDLALDEGRLAEAEALGLDLARLVPHQPWVWLRLAEARRRRDNPRGAEEALAEARALDPDSPEAYRKGGEIALLAAEEARAVELWRGALARDPANEKLANRVAFLAPEVKESWELDAPDEAAIAAAIAARDTTAPLPGADIIDLLDHEVTRINLDGSATNLVTQVMHAVNESGRDRLTRVPMRDDGRVRVQHAYAIDPAGERVPVSSIRDNEARFRGLRTGSTVVLQYRHDAEPVGYLARHVARGWWFQGPARQMRQSSWIVWAPKQTKVHEWVLGGVERREETRGDEIRVEWTAKDLPPIIGEPMMPTMAEVAANMMFSTVPDWQTFLEWEKSLLHEVFRETEGLKQLATELFRGAKTTEAKLERLHDYLMKEIRYQQDYEDHIAGVKPHPAPMVVERGYGDCKDKAILFITLARLAGIDVHFAIVRTRSHGPMREQVPMQQFNHAIVYVPAQAGLAEGRFFDPTADALDLDSLPLDDQGITALVLDTKRGEWKWLTVPLQTAAHNQRTIRSRLRLAEDGSASGGLTLESRGHEASFYRRLARNAEQLKQAGQVLIGHAFPGAQATDVRPREVQDLAQPALIELDVTSPTHGRIVERELRVAFPRLWTPEAVFRLAERKYPLVMGPPMASRWVTELELPKGVSVVKLPAEGTVEGECLRFTRRVNRRGGVVTLEDTLETRCERIEPERYGQHRTLVQEVVRMYQDELVLRLGEQA